jgi:hypothetical protein
MAAAVDPGVPEGRPRKTKFGRLGNLFGLLFEKLASLRL